MFTTIKAKLLAFFLSLVLFAFLSTFISDYYLRNNEKEIADITRKIEKINNLVWEDIRITRDFFSNETINPNFYKTGESHYLKMHYAICREIDSSMILLNKNQSNNHFNLDKEIKKLNFFFNKYCISMDSIIKNITLRGYKDYGVEKEMRNYAHALENFESEISLADILELRRHEKDFIIRQEDQYILKHKKLTEFIKIKLMASASIQPDKKNEILTLLNKYSLLFNKMVDYDRKIGLKTQRGIKKEIDKAIENMALSFNLIKTNALIKETYALKKIRSYYVGIWSIYLTISILFSFYFSRKFSLEVSGLKNRVIEFVKSDFKKKNVFQTKESKYELDVLSAHLNVMEKHIAKLMKELKETNKELQTFIYRASHDLKNPVSSIQGLVNVAKIEVRDTNALDYFSMIDSSCYRLNNIIEELALINVIKIGTIEKNRVEIKDLIYKTIASFKSIKNLDNIIFSTEFHLQTELYTDERLLKIILSNLIENSIKHSKNSTSYSFIKIKVTQDAPEMVRIDIEDNGVGIAKDVQENIFDMFFRNTHLVNSTGLGLYIVQNALKRLNGAIKLESTEGEGTRFSVFLPNSIITKKIAERVSQNERLVAAHTQFALNYI